MKVYQNLLAKFLGASFKRTACRLMSENVTTHLERTVAIPREPVTAVGRVVQVTPLSKTVMMIAIHVADIKFKFKAGQWVDFMIPGIDTVGGFSMMSSPSKLKKHQIIELAVKKSDHPPACWVHSKCRIGDNVSLKVGGDFCYDPLSDNCKELLLIAGGVGINPLYSIIEEIYETLQINQLERDTKITLLYTASSVDELILKDKLEAMARTTENIKCQMFVTQEGCHLDNKDRSKVIFGRITTTVLEDTLNTFNIDTTTAYVCGPPPMIKHVTTTLENAGLNKWKIKREQWW